MNHNISVEITKQISLTFSFTDKISLKLVYASKYLQHFDLNMRYKSGKSHIISDALFELTFINRLNINLILKLNTLHTQVDESIDDYAYMTTLVKINSDFCHRIVEDYAKDQVYIKSIKVLKDNADLGSENTVKISFYQKRDELIYHINKTTNSQHKRICVSEFMTKSILNAAHDESYLEFD